MQEKKKNIINKEKGGLCLNTLKFMCPLNKNSDKKDLVNVMKITKFGGCGSSILFTCFLIIMSKYLN